MVAPFVALLLLSLGGLLWARRDDATRGRVALVTKASASCSFLGVALVATPHDPGWALAVRIALVASLLGDLALVGSSRRHVLAGMVLFFLAHVAFAVAFGRRIGAVHDLSQARTWAVLLACCAPALLASGLTVRWSWEGMGPLRPAGVIYGVAVAVTAGLALGLALLDPAAPGAVVVGVGGALFLFSDIAVARQRFVEDAWINRVIGLPTYYAGQVLLATSVGLVGVG